MVVNFIVFICYYGLTVIMAGYSMNTIGMSSGLAGIVVGVFIVAGLVSRIISGSIIDDVGYKKSLFIGLAIYFIATLMYFIADGFVMMLITRILHGAGWGIATTATATLVSYLVPEDRRGEGIGYFSLSITLASAIGPLIGMGIYQRLGFDTLTILNVVLVIMSIIITVFLNEPSITLVREDSAGFRISDFFELSVMPLSIIGLLTFFSYSSILGFLDTFTVQLHLETAGSLFFVVYSVAIILTRPFTGKWFDTRGRNFVTIPSFILFAAGMFVISQANSTMTLFAAAALMGLGFGTFSFCGQVIAVNMVPKNRIALATSTFLAISQVGIGIGPLTQGFILDAIGYRGMFISMGVIILVGMVLYYLIYGKDDQPAVQEDQ